jgi:ribosome-binding protein aMBF1 (putative translation factor)
MITGQQCRMARAALDWSIKVLAGRANVGEATIRRLERERVRPIPSTASAIRTALEAAGVEFIEENGGGPGVRLRKAQDS